MKHARYAIVITASLLCLPAAADITVSEAVKICADYAPGGVSADNMTPIDSDNADYIAHTWTTPAGVPIVCNVSKSAKDIVNVTTPKGAIAKPMLEQLRRARDGIASVKAGDGRFVAYAKERISARLKDPSAAQFRNLFLADKESPTLCGEINGKNSYGAYIGFTRFYFMTDDYGLHDIEPARGDSVFSGMWQSMCGKKKEDVPS